MSALGIQGTVTYPYSWKDVYHMVHSLRPGSATLPLLLAGNLCHPDACTAIHTKLGYRTRAQLRGDMWLETEQSTKTLSDAVPVVCRTSDLTQSKISVEGEHLRCSSNVIWYALAVHCRNVHCSIIHNGEVTQNGMCLPVLTSLYPPSQWGPTLKGQRSEEIQGSLNL